MNQRQKFHGLTESLVTMSRKIHGANIITLPKDNLIWQRALAKLSSPVYLVFAIAWVLSLFVAVYKFSSGSGFDVFFPAIGIFVAFILWLGCSLLLQFIIHRQHLLFYKEEDNRMVTVYRNDLPTTIPLKEIVAGDVVMLSTGDVVPASGELLDSIELIVDESEYQEGKIEKKRGCRLGEGGPDIESACKVLKNSKVIGGHGVMRVKTVNSESASQPSLYNSDDSSISGRIKKIEGILSKIAYRLAIAVVAGRIIIFFTLGGQQWSDFFSFFLDSVMMATAIVIVSSPDSLPLARLLPLACSWKRILRQNIFVRDPKADILAGETDVVLADADAVITNGTMEVAHPHLFLPREEEFRVYQGMAVNSTAQLKCKYGECTVLGSPMEGAMLKWLQSTHRADYVSMRKNTRIEKQLAYSSQRKYMATVVADDGRRFLYVKGAPEIVLRMCEDSLEVPRRKVKELVKKYRAEGLPSVGFAYCELRDNESPFEEDSVAVYGLRFAALLAFSSSVDKEIPNAVADLHNAGIDVKMLSVENSEVASRLAITAGLINEEDDEAVACISSTELEKLSDLHLQSVWRRIKVFSRIRPHDKLRLVRFARSLGENSTVTGTSLDDIPAMNESTVSVSTAQSASMVKAASSINLTDNSFDTIKKAIAWGRTHYLNLKRILLFQLPVNLSAVLIVFFGAFMGVGSPISITQLLWINIVFGLISAIALSSLQPDNSCLKPEEPGSRDHLVDMGMISRIASVSGIFFILMLGMLYLLQHIEIYSLLDLLRPDLEIKTDTGILGPHPGELSPYELSLFFTIFTFLHFWNLFNVKAFRSGTTAFSLRYCKYFVALVVLIFALQILIISLGGNFMDTTPLKFIDWLLIIGITSFVLWVGEAVRAIRRRLSSPAVKFMKVRPLGRKKKPSEAK